MGSRRRPTAHDIAAEIIRRATAGDKGPCYVVRLSDPPTAGERLQLMAAKLQGTPIAIVPHPCATVAEWIERHAKR
jgi:hypothetical protein